MTVDTLTKPEGVSASARCTSTRDVYTYDGNGTLLKREHLADHALGWTRGASTVYMGGVYEKHLDGSVTKYYQAFGRTIALRQVPPGGGQGTLYWPLLDHLGTTVGMTDASGVLVASQSYWPYGAQRSASTITQTDKLYTGQQMEAGDSALGMYNYKARFYSTTLGRFVSSDPRANGLDRYEYAKDNPLRFNDPTGLDAASDLRALAAASNDRSSIAFGWGASEWRSFGSLVDRWGVNVIASFNEQQRSALREAIEDNGRALGFDENSMEHMYRDASGHWAERTSETDSLAQDTASSIDFLQIITPSGERIYAQIDMITGDQIWASVGHTGLIQNGGVNIEALQWGYGETAQQYWRRTVDDSRSADDDIPVEDQIDEIPPPPEPELGPIGEPNPLDGVPNDPGAGGSLFPSIDSCLETGEDMPCF